MGGENFLKGQAYLLLDLALGEPRVVELRTEVLQQRLVHRALEFDEGIAPSRRTSGARAVDEDVVSIATCLSETVGESHDPPSGASTWLERSRPRSAGWRVMRRAAPSVASDAVFCPTR